MFEGEGQIMRYTCRLVVKVNTRIEIKRKSVKIINSNGIKIALSYRMIYF